MDFYQKYRLKCAEKGLSTSAAALAGISRTSVQQIGVNYGVRLDKRGIMIYNIHGR